MKTLEYTIQDEQGIHARPAGMLVKAAASFASDLMIAAKGKEVSLKKLFAVMSLGIKKGDIITITADGTDEDAAISALQTLLQENL